jgi:hypothetical protein
MREKAYTVLDEETRRKESTWRMEAQKGRRY